MAGLRPIPKMIEHVGYSAAKHGVVALTRSFVPGRFTHREICPPFFPTLQILQIVIVSKRTRFWEFIHILLQNYFCALNLQFLRKTFYFLFYFLILRFLQRYSNIDVWIFFGHPDKFNKCKHFEIAISAFSISRWSMSFLSGYIRYLHTMTI